MPTSRPATATISATDPIATHAIEVYCVDQSSGSSLVGLKGVGPALLRQGTVPYDNTTPIGKAIKGNSAGAFAAGIDFGNPIGRVFPPDPVSTMPFSMGVIFSFAGTKTIGSGQEALVSLGDGATPSGPAFFDVIIDDGSNGHNGHIFTQARTAASTNIVNAVGVAVGNGVQQAAALHCDASGNVTLSLDGTNTTALTGAVAAFATQWFGTFCMGARTASLNSGILIFPISAQVTLSLSWYATAGISAADCQAWTADPWTILQASSSATDVTMSGANTGGASHPSGNITVGLNGSNAGTVICTLTDSSSAGHFEQSGTIVTAVSIVAGVSQQVQYVPHTTGSRNLNCTNNGGLANPSNLAFTASGQNIAVTCCKTSSDGSARTSITGICFAFWDAARPDLITGPPTDKGNWATLDGSGVLHNIGLGGTSLTTGQIGTLGISTTDGTTTQSPAPFTQFFPVAIA